MHFHSDSFQRKSNDIFPIESEFNRVPQKEPAFARRGMLKLSYNLQIFIYYSSQILNVWQLFITTWIRIRICCMYYLSFYRWREIWFSEQEGKQIKDQKKLWWWEYLIFWLICNSLNNWVGFNAPKILL